MSDNGRHGLKQQEPTGFRTLGRTESTLCICKFCCSHSLNQPYRRNTQGEMRNPECSKKQKLSLLHTEQQVLRIAVMCKQARFRPQPRHRASVITSTGWRNTGHPVLLRGCVVRSCNDHAQASHVDILRKHSIPTIHVEFM